MQYRHATVRMVLVLAMMLMCVGARCGIVWFNFFIGAPFVLKYYVAYMMAEVLPLLPVLALATIAFYARRNKAGDGGLSSEDGAANNDYDF